jgi:hypothetical protein
MTDHLTGNGSAELFMKRIRLLVELADVEYEIQKSHWSSGHISDSEYKQAVDEFVTRTQTLQKQLHAWQELQQ